MKEIRICSMDSDRVVLEAIMEGVNGIIRAKNEESAPSASINTGSPKLLDEMERFAVMCDRAGNGRDARLVRSWVKQLRAGA